MSTTPEQAAATSGFMAVHADAVLTRVQEAPGLTPDMRRFLALRMLHADDVGAAKAAGIHPATPHNWKRETPAFAREYTALLEAGAAGVVSYVRTELQRIVGMVPETLAEMLVAEEEIPAGKNGDTIVRPAWLARAKAVELLYRPLGLWQPEASAPQPSEGAALFGEMAAILRLRREEMEAARTQRRSDATIIEGATTEQTGGSVSGNARE